MKVLEILQHNQEMDFLIFLKIISGWPEEFNDTQNVGLMSKTSQKITENSCYWPFGGFYSSLGGHIFQNHQNDFGVNRGFQWYTMCGSNARNLTKITENSICVQFCRFSSSPWWSYFSKWSKIISVRVEDSNDNKYVGSNAHNSTKITENSCYWPFGGFYSSP